jgi:hypothetical protein
MKQKTGKSKDLQQVTAIECAYVEWVDAVADAGWEETNAPETHLCRTLGFIVAEDDKAICVASAISFKESNAKIHIPKGWIEKIKRFKLNKLTEVSKKPRAKKPTPVEDQCITSSS